MNKAFLITIDTEADNQWNPNQPPTTENAKYLPRFQELCEKYKLKPTWLTTYEMANDPFFVEYFKEKQDKGLCEIGMHLHAWNTPPYYELKKRTNERSYLIEYPEDIMEAKISSITELLTNKFGKAPISHRAGRWAMNETYFKLLSKYGYKIDCSVTPGVNWNKSLGTTGLSGNDYRKYPQNVYRVNDDLIEIPMTIRKMHFFDLKSVKSVNPFKKILSETYKLINGRLQWLRPNSTNSYIALKKLLNRIYNEKSTNYAMFMIHSSELMPSGSPIFKNQNDIERLYISIEKLFENVNEQNFVSFALKGVKDAF